MGLFKPAWMSVDKEKALRAVQKETDRQKLIVAARNAPLSIVRDAAWKTLEMH